MMHPNKIIHTHRTNPDFHDLVRELDAFLAITDGDEHAFYDQFNKLDHIDHVVLLFQGEVAVSCGAFKQFDHESVEIKRMFTKEGYRGKRYAEKILESLEHKALEMGYIRCVLETGVRQTAAVALYERCGYTRIPCYGQYKDMPNSVCYEKNIGE